MNTLEHYVTQYLNHCLTRKRLAPKTLNAYRYDLRDFALFIQESQGDFTDKNCIGNYIDSLHKTKSGRTVKRKIASFSAFFHYLIYEDLLPENPLCKLDLSFKLPYQLPRYIPNYILKDFYKVLYDQKASATTEYQFRCSLRNIAVIELLFATGLRISELCDLTLDTVNLTDRVIRIRGKGDKERIIQLTENATLNALSEYATAFREEINHCGFFFVNGYGNRLSDQSIRNMIHKLSALSPHSFQITPHMFRHSFASSLVNQDVDIRCIQELLGHSSIKTTEIYTHVNITKQKSILETKNPRKMLD